MPTHLAVLEKEKRGEVLRRDSTISPREVVFLQGVWDAGTDETQSKRGGGASDTTHTHMRTQRSTNQTHTPPRQGEGGEEARRVAMGTHVASRKSALAVMGLVTECPNS